SIHSLTPNPFSFLHPTWQSTTYFRPIRWKRCRRSASGLSTNVASKRRPIKRKEVFMRVAFLSLPVPGHLNPMTALARKYQARGHSVVFLSLLDVAPFVQVAQLPFVPCSEDAYPQGSLGKYLKRLSRLSGTEALSYTVNEMMKSYTETLFQSLPETLRKAG